MLAEEAGRLLGGAMLPAGVALCPARLLNGKEYSR
jgi:hypothetical protein